MKTVFLPIMAILLFAGCSPKADNAEVEQTDTDSIQCEEIEDAEEAQMPVAFQTKKIVKEEVHGRWKYSLDADYPVAGDPLIVNSVREWINECMGGTYMGDLADTVNLFAHYAKEYFDEANHEEDDWLKQMDAYCSYDIQFLLTWQSDKLLTYINTGYTYTGGAHGMTAVEGRTFRKSDGHRFGREIIRDQNDMQDNIKQGLMKYFEVSTDEALEENLMLDDDIHSVTYLPMPQADPWIDKKGLHLMYGQYEIACYAAGMPDAVIPINKAKKYLTATILKEL